MTKTWTKPQMCQVAAGFEITRYAEAKIEVRKDARK